MRVNVATPRKSLFAAMDKLRDAVHAGEC
jgi:bifunctional pyridoxal-dependent enzyme with beta-cystathionase and maltose regulon repressor activities